MPHILVVDDEEDLRALLTGFLRRHGHEVSVAANGRQMYLALETKQIDLIVLDIMLSGEDGFVLCRHLHATCKVPVIILSAVAEPVDRVVGLEIGADDYLTKPFDPRELIARVKAVLRRCEGKVESSAIKRTGKDLRPVLMFAGWKLDISRRELRRSGNTLVMLSGAEFDLLLAFVEHAQRVLSRDQLLDLARGTSHSAYDRSIDVLVGRLRRKLEVDIKNPSLIRTVRGGGYVFSSAVHRV